MVFTIMYSQPSAAAIKNPTTYLGEVQTIRQLGRSVKKRRQSRPKKTSAREDILSMKLSVGLSAFVGTQLPPRTVWWWLHAGGILSLVAREKSYV